MLTRADVDRAIAAVHPNAGVIVFSYEGRLRLVATRDALTPDSGVFLIVVASNDASRRKRRRQGNQPNRPADHASAVPEHRDG